VLGPGQNPGLGRPRAAWVGGRRLTAEDVGHRVVVRRIVDVRAGRLLYSDLLGELVELSEHSLTVNTRDGRIGVPATEVAYAKRIPDQRRLTATERLELIAARGWPAPDTERLGDWWLRAAGGWTSRANSALAVGDPGLPFPEAVEAVLRWYAARDQPAAIAVPLPVGGRILPLLQRRGWRSAPRVDVCTAALPPLVHADDSIQLDPQPPGQWLAALAAVHGLPEMATHVLTAVPQVRFAGAYADASRATAIARGVVADEWLGISLLHVDPGNRRRGWARRITGALAAWATELGADRAYVQVEEHNAQAHALYAGLGFAVHHSYVTWWAET
jgi:GNAT superfamily N-acetyltransferase